jgi:hypothetical protein
VSNRKRRQMLSSDDTSVATPQRDEDLARWCEQMGLSPTGEPLPAMEAAKRAQAAMLADIAKQAETPRYKIPFYKLPFTRDL